ncbi:hypothetical protein F4801DRAFT_586658 [Xylaria longipes]|nr:hypothetical protein F4801DRAFT_586658 [Xylaria longipes]
MISTAPSYHLPTNTSEASLKAATLPPYTEHASISTGDEDIELASLSPSTSASSCASPPAATAPSPSSSPSTFAPTKQLGDESQTPLSTTTYRFGPGRPPVTVLADPARDPPQSAGEEGEGMQEGFEILGRSLFSRAVRFQVSGLGSFGWRYANSKERASAAADSLLVCEVNGEGKEKGGVPRRIAQLVRNETYRSPGTTRSSAGTKRRERVEWLVVTTAVTMLKREVDRWG